MGKKLDALLRRDSKTAKLKTLANLAISRIAILKKQHHVRCSQAQSDVIQLLNLGHQDHALLRVQHVIKEQSMLDVQVMIENYCYLLLEKLVLIQNNREFPLELKEAMSSLIFAASRCGELPELQQIRLILTSRFGKEFDAQAVELKNNCGVNPKMTQKLSSRQTSLESRLKVLKQIACDKGIPLHLENDTSLNEDKQGLNRKRQPFEPNEAAFVEDPELGVDPQHLPETTTQDDKLSESVRAGERHNNATTAAHKASELAAYAAVPARAPVKLSRPESLDEDPNDNCSSTQQKGIVVDLDVSSTSKLQIDEDAVSKDVKHSETSWCFYKIHPVGSFSSESEGKETADNGNGTHLKQSERSRKQTEREGTLSASSLESERSHLRNSTISSTLHHENGPLRREVAFDESDEGNAKNQDKIQCSKHHQSDSNKKLNSTMANFPQTRQYNEVEDGLHSDRKEYKLHRQSPKLIPLSSEADFITHSSEESSNLATMQWFNAEKHLHLQHSKGDKKAVLTRTGHVRRG